jgi:MFS family permease
MGQAAPDEGDAGNARYTISSLAPTLGPTIGGWITDNYTWHWLFFINLIPGTFVAVVVPMLVRVDRPNLKLLRGADYLGMALMATLSRLSRIHVGGGAAMGLVRR